MDEGYERILPDFTPHVNRFAIKRDDPVPETA
jgi:hypothetical protein